ncbi:methylthioribulose 1-phosphate dehydratase [Dactylosporangium fulvum]|uniref:Methylthioribulose-1-phosphate dehydratase n=1 Tax=Dactylosporangium fulvum TaxID=53359 RepID=A0ABY5VQY5_9ACTN|nr:methylthioribulose 1-phosphate dehydratase [Dactylosporangium fulvum]UWP79945.1 methylthioribulose 1-phosphate dehydratase [Dactylosporangium fulvum]
MNQHLDRATAAAGLAQTARDLYRRGWMDGTAGNLSARLAEPAHAALITASGRSKGSLTAQDMVAVDAVTGQPLEPGGPPPSAETSIHAAVYRTVPGCGAVVHAHPPHATAVAVLAARDDRDAVRFTDLEVIKGLAVPDPTAISVPVFTNWLDVRVIGSDVAAYLTTNGSGIPPVLLIAFHGATAWGPTLDVARNRLECLEALCQLSLLTGQYPARTEMPIRGA